MIDEDRLRFIWGFAEQRCTTDTADCMLLGNGIAYPRRCRLQGIGAHKLDDHAIRVLQPQDRLAEFLRGALRLEAGAQGARQPETDARGIDGERNFSDLTDAGAARRTIFPDQKGNQRARRTHGVAIEEMKLCGVLEAAGALDEAQAEEADVEIDIRLDLAGNQRDVMDAGDHEMLQTVILFWSLFRLGPLFNAMRRP